MIDKFLNILDSSVSECSGDEVTTEGSSNIIVESIDQQGNANFGLSALTELTIPYSFSVPTDKTITISGDSGLLDLGGVLTFQDGSQFILNSGGSEVRGIFEFEENNILDVQQSADFQSSISIWNNSQIKIDESADLRFLDNQLKTQGNLTKTGGTISFDNVSWSLLENTSFTSDSAVEVSTLNLNNYELTLGSVNSDLSVEDNITFDSSSEKILAGSATLTLEGNFVMSDGEVSSSGGIVFLEK